MGAEALGPPGSLRSETGQSCVGAYLVFVTLVLQVLPKAAQWAADVAAIAPHAYRQVFLFLDGTVRQTCMPCPAAWKRLEAQYSGYHYHGFKVSSNCSCVFFLIQLPGHLQAHALITPSGMAAHYFGAVDGRRHDSFLMQASGIFPLLSELRIDGVDYQVYADSAYPVTPNLVSPIPRAAAPTGSVAAELNRVMAVVRTCTSEWWYGVITNTFQALDFARWQRQHLTRPCFTIYGRYVLSKLSYLYGWWQ